MPKPSRIKGESKIRFESVKLDALFEVLEAVACLTEPTAKDIAQFADIDVRTAGKVLKNARLIGLVDSPDDKTFILSAPYPFKGTAAQKHAVVREALLRLPLVQGIKQFMALGNNLPDSMRKAATQVGEKSYDASSVSPLVKLANHFSVLEFTVRVETLVETAVEAKAERHSVAAESRMAFISHSSVDKPFVRQLAADLVSSGVQVWLDEQRIRAGDSIPESVAQGVAESDAFLLVVSKDSVVSPWVQKELSQALVHEIEKRKTRVIPLLIDKVALPETVREKKYANFTNSYAAGLGELLKALKSK